MLVTKALSQDVMVLAFVPLFANPRGVAQPPLQSTYPHDIRFTKCYPTFEFYRNTFTFYRLALFQSTFSLRTYIFFHKQQLFFVRKRSVSNNRCTIAFSVISLF
ncbi:hypothetical protein [Lysinibacillus xylanilyticus]|uniref:hypothetical protein n=1 Tax=Lysinibacillus xylanilyticus TaxID=582475 RepID=UPI003829E601